MRRVILAVWLAAVPLAPAMADVRLSINLGGFPALQPIPGYPVYYAPAVDANYFFYDGLYWVFDGANWYSSGWYNGPWRVVDPFYVPVYLLRVPVRYYHRPPAYFHSWRADAAPHWHEHYGREWAERRRGWDHWDHRNAPRPAPLPTYQRDFRGDRYPHDVQRQAEIHNRNYNWRSNDALVQREHEQSAAAQQPRHEQWERHNNPQERINRERNQNGGGG
jgi:hypothetical protein